MNKKEFMNGLKDGYGIAAGYFAFTLAFGLAVKTYNIPDFAGILMSIFMYAGVAQFIVLKMLHSGSGFIEIIFTTILVNLRYILFSMSFSTKFKDRSPVVNFLTFGLTDESYMMSYFREDKLTASYMAGLNLISYLAFNIGTITGILFSSMIHPDLKRYLGLAIYAILLKLIIPQASKSIKILMICIVSVIANIVFTLKFFGFINPVYKMVVLSIGIPLVFAVIDEKEEVSA